MKAFENKIVVCAKMRQEMESEGDVRNLALRERRMDTLFIWIKLSYKSIQQEMENRVCYDPHGRFFSWVVSM